MVIYEVNVTIRNEIYDQYYAWLLKHIEKMLQFSGFKKAELGLIDQEQYEEKTIRINYSINSYDDLKNYLINHAPSMRAEGLEKFGDKFHATRRIIIEPIYLEG